VRGERNPLLIADDDRGFRAFVARLLTRAGYETRQAESGEEALAFACEERPALVLLDVRLPGISGYEVLRELREELGDDLPIAFVTGVRTEPFDRVAGLLLGADDYVIKPFAPDELLARVRALTRRSREREPPRRVGLTPRELDVLHLLAQGLTQEEMAERLVISPKTVATHIEHVLAKLEVHSRAQAVARAYRDSLLDETRA